MNQKKELLIANIQNMDDQQIENMYAIFHAFSNQYLSKGDLMKIVYTDKQNGKVDSAVPCEYVKRIQELYPGFKTQFMVYSYHENHFGEFNNLAELFVNKLHEILTK